MGDHPEGKNRGSVIDITARLPSRIASVTVRPEPGERLVVLRFDAPPEAEVRSIEVGLELSQASPLIEGILYAAARVAAETWSTWLAHLSVEAGYASVCSEAEHFVRLWKVLRPDVLMRPAPSRDRVVSAATEAAECALRAADTRDPGRCALFIRAVLAHLSYERLPLAAWTTTGAPCPVPGAVLPWDLPL